MHDLHDYTGTMEKFIEHIKGEEERSALKRFFRYEDKHVWLTPFSYSADQKERTGGFNDDEHFLLNLKTKVKVTDYFEMAGAWGPDFVVTPCEQVTAASGKKKRKRSLKAGAKHALALARLIRDAGEDKAVLASVMLGDEGGLDTYEMRHFLRTVI